jgi:hypothetical protein
MRASAKSAPALQHCQTILMLQPASWSNAILLLLSAMSAIRMIVCCGTDGKLQLRGGGG